MPDREKVIKSLKWFRDRDSWREGIMIHDDHAEVRKRICDDALAMLKEQEERRGNYVPYKVKTPTGKWNGEKCSVCGTEYIGSAPLQWKFCPDCGAKMEGR